MAVRGRERGRAGWVPPGFVDWGGRTGEEEWGHWLHWGLGS